MNEEGVRVFLSYSQKDQALVDRLTAYLAALELRGEIQSWSDRKVEAGEDWAHAITSYIDSADIVLLAVSLDFLASDYSRIEVERALKQHHTEQTPLVLILLRPVDLSDSPFAEFQVSPSNGRPITAWESQDEALLDVVRDIRKIAHRLKAQAIG